jgi:hypothetical protein
MDSHENRKAQNVDGAFGLVKNGTWHAYEYAGR